MVQNALITSTGAGWHGKKHEGKQPRLYKLYGSECRKKDVGPRPTQRRRGRSGQGAGRRAGRRRGRKAGEQAEEARRPTKQGQKPKDKERRAAAGPSNSLQRETGCAKSVRLMLVAARVLPENSSDIGLPYEDAQGLPVAAKLYARALASVESNAAGQCLQRAEGGGLTAA